MHFLGRIDTQLKVRGHRVEAQAVEDILQTQFREIEAAVLDYQNQELVAFVVAPSLCEGEIPVVAPAPPEWAARVTESLARRLPAPSVPTRIFLVEEFVLNPVSGKIDRTCLPDLSQLRCNAASQAEEISGGSPKRTQVEEPGAGIPPDIDADAEPASDEVLAICREVFDNTALGWDDVFADHGGHSILIAELTLLLQVAGWKVTVRDLLSGCNTARRVSTLPRDLQQTSEPPPAATQFDRRCSERDEAVAEVLSIKHFATLQALFLLLLYSPHLMGFLALVAVVRISELFLSPHLWDVYSGRLSDIFVGPLVALRERALGHGDQALPGWRHLQERREARCLPQVEQSAFANLVYRAAGTVGPPAAEDDDPQRTAHGMGVTPARGDRG